tara:strand:- start:1252 stop:1992 length:741 start_codon:yes stop_codon:yes gene_type:complete
MAAATTIVMAAGAAVSAGSSFIQANKQKKIQQKAERDAAKFMKEARSKLETNYMEELSLSMEPYERAREQNLVASSAQMQQAVEGDERGGAATAGKVLQAQQQQEQNIQGQQIQAMQDLERATVEEEMALRDAKVKLDLGQYQGNVDRAADAAATRQKMIQQGIDSTIKLGGMAAQEFTPLFTKEQGAGTNLGNLNFQQTFQGSQNYGVPNFQNQFSGLNYSPNLNLSNLGTNNPNLFSQYQMNNY